MQLLCNKYSSVWENAKQKIDTDTKGNTLERGENKPVNEGWLGLLVGPNCFYLDDTLSKLNLKLNEKPPPNLEHTRTTRVTHKRRHRRVVVVVVVTNFITHYHLKTTTKKNMRMYISERHQQQQQHHQESVKKTSWIVLNAAIIVQIVKTSFITYI